MTVFIFHLMFCDFDFRYRDIDDLSGRKVENLWNFEIVSTVRASVKVMTNNIMGMRRLL